MFFFLKKFNLSQTVRNYYPNSVSEGAKGVINTRYLRRTQKLSGFSKKGMLN